MRILILILLLLPTICFAQGRYLNNTTDSVTCEMGTTDNAVLDSIAASTSATQTAVEGTLTVTGGGGGTEYTEDVATANPIVGTATMIERDDALTTVTPIEGDNIGLRGTAEGALWTQDFNSDAILADTASIDSKITACNTGAVTVSAALPAGTNNIGDVDVLSSALPTGASTSANQLADGHNVTIDNLTGAAAVNIQDGGNSITVDGTVTANLSATDNTVLDKIDTQTAAIQTAVQILDNVVAGSEAQVDVITQPVRARTTDSVSAAIATDALMVGTTALTPKFVIIDAATSGDNTILAAVTAKKIRVISAFLMCAGTTTVRFESGAAGTALTGQMSMIANTGFVLPYNPLGWFETASNTLLNLELSAAVSCDGSITYVEV